MALYLFPVAVAEGQGLSHYSDAAIAMFLPPGTAGLERARQVLVRAQLITYRGAYESCRWRSLLLGSARPRTLVRQILRQMERP